MNLWGKRRRFHLAGNVGRIIRAAGCLPESGVNDLVRPGMRDDASIVPYK